ncbi:methyltransferase domain-containing protein [Halovivax gelatinilyticus]|uniref:methyltransferase domain-containing protein n=1 Tax=Halovivax gelatinilyticus TaxID=2961597 RepID=UPI0020CA3217|nr:methyltransferase domain-containing protein [Halovivax gelatinilyticus]
MYVLELGGEDDAFAIAEARAAATGLEPLGPGLALAKAISHERVRTLAYTRRASELVGRTDAALASARVLLETAALDRAGTVAVRATDVKGTTGIDTAEAERTLGGVLTDRGYSVDLDDPDHVLRASFSEGPIDPDSGSVLKPADGENGLAHGTDAATGDHHSVCALGWLAAESVRDFGDRRPTDKPFFQPGSMDPLLARAVVNLAGARPNATVLDPMCGTGGVLVEAGLVGANVIGTDAQVKMVRGARENLAHFLDPTAESSLPNRPGRFDVARADATALPLADDAVDAVVFDAPYGRQSKIETHRLEDLVSGALEETRRVADRGVIVADRSWASLAREAGWTIDAAFERRVHRSLTRYVLVLV